MNQLLQNIAEKISPFFLKIELALWAGVVTGLVMKRAGASIDNFIMICFSLIALLYFLPASLPFAPETTQGQKENPRLLESIYNTVLHKASGIGLAVAVIGLQFYEIGRKGYSEMLVLGSASTTLISALVLVGVMMKNTKRIPVLYRSLALLLVSVYFLWSDGYFG
ncbi:MAG: hypothetical protein IM613_19100 [Cytophagales bacterium]|jgi:hypothetical protein|nr:hypothetical protein [Cytophagales bacterium]MCA6431545.1 hypothetical protein [Cytophagales bacterium]